MMLIPCQELSMLKRIHHTAIICSNYEKSKHFYTKILGLEDEYTGKRLTFFSDPDSLPLEIYEV
jgi:catechol 2,3-dioxygenase-like lactoylglutathione lyase family enzyme